MKSTHRTVPFALSLAAMLLLPACASHRSHMASPVAVSIGTVSHAGAEIPVFDARKVRCDMSVPPRYPEAAKREGIPGVATVRIVIDEQGEAIAFEVVSSMPVAEFGEAALEAARRWTFFPMVGEDGEPMVYAVEMPVRFAVEVEPVKGPDGLGATG